MEHRRIEDPYQGIWFSKQTEKSMGYQTMLTIVWKGKKKYHPYKTFLDQTISIYCVLEIIISTKKICVCIQHNILHNIFTTSLMITRTTRTPAFWDNPHRLMITHTSGSHQIPSQNKTKSKLQNLKNCQKFKFLNFASNFICDTPSEAAW